MTHPIRYENAKAVLIDASNKFIQQLRHDQAHADYCYFLHQCKVMGLSHTDASEEYFIKQCRILRDEADLDDMEVRDVAFRNTQDRYKK